MKTFVFTGDWSPYVDLPAFHQFRLTYNRQAPAPQTSPRQIQLMINDERTLDPDPFREQLAAIDYLLQHEQEIADTLLAAVYKEYPEFSEWEYKAEDDYPPLSSPDMLRSMFDIQSADIKLAQRDGMAYIVFYGHCTWHEKSNEGLGILLHKDRVVSVSTYHSFYSEIPKDGGHRPSKATGAETTISPSSEKTHWHSPHPKYGTLKPWQQRSNYEYPYHLILTRQNEEFMVAIESGLLSVDHVGGEVRDSYEYRGTTLLECACACGNEALVHFLLSRKPASVKNCLYHVSGNRDMIRPLLDAGADINEGHRTRRYGTVIAQQAMALRENRKYQKEMAEIESMIQWLIAQGADPYIKDTHGLNAFSVAELLSEKSAIKLVTFLETSYQKFRPGGRT